MSEPQRTRKDLVQEIYDQHAADGHPISLSKAGRIADKIFRGTFGGPPAPAPAITYADPTGEDAATLADGGTLAKGRARSIVRPREAGRGHNSFR